MGILKEYLSKVYHEQDDLPTKKISIMINNYEVDNAGNPTGFVSKRVEGNTPQEFKADFERKFKREMTIDMWQAFLKLFKASIERAKEAGTTAAEVDAALLPKDISKEQWAKKTGRGITRH